MCFLAAVNQLLLNIYVDIWSEDSTPNSFHCFIFNKAAGNSIRESKISLKWHIHCFLLDNTWNSNSFASRHKNKYAGTWAVCPFNLFSKREWLSLLSVMCYCHRGSSSNFRKSYWNRCRYSKSSHNRIFCFPSIRCWISFCQCKSLLCCNSSVVWKSLALYAIRFHIRVNDRTIT